MIRSIKLFAWGAFFIAIALAAPFGISLVGFGGYLLACTVSALLVWPIISWAVASDENYQQTGKHPWQ